MDIRDPRHSARRQRGTQAITRAVELLKLVAAHQAGGARYADIVRQSGLEPPTVHRILQGLTAEGLLRQDPRARRYTLGTLAFELGLAAQQHFSLREVCAPALQRICDATGDTVFLTVRSGFEAVCVDRKQGYFPVQVLTVEVGSRRPLGTAAGNLALLFPLPDEEVHRIIEANAERLTRHGQLDRDKLLAMIRRSRQIGYALNDEVILPGVTGIGLAVPARFGPPACALSVVGLASRLREKRRTEVVRLLRAETAALAKVISYPD
jgi:DNA-binding IclR family transcriptional regulator